MKFSIPLIYVIILFVFCIVIIKRAKREQLVNTAEVQSVNFLLVAFFVWTLISSALGLKGIHASVWLMKHVPLLWQACTPVVILLAALFFSRNLRNALHGIAAGTPWHWLIFIQALRLGALGGVIKGIKGEITSGYILWIGIPDFLYGLSAIIVGGLLLRKAVSNRFLIIWNLIGPAIILLPTFIFMNHWMNEPGFTFIMEFPMVLAPSIVVPIFLFLNFLLAWRVYEITKKGKERTTKALVAVDVACDRMKDGIYVIGNAP